jgi:hypothetical protein
VLRCRNRSLFIRYQFWDDSVMSMIVGPGNMKIEFCPLPTLLHLNCSTSTAANIPIGMFITSFKIIRIKQILLSISCC